MKAVLSAILTLLFAQTLAVAANCPRIDGSFECAPLESAGETTFFRAETIDYPDSTTGYILQGLGLRGVVTTAQPNTQGFVAQCLVDGVLTLIEHEDTRIDEVPGWYETRYILDRDPVTQVLKVHSESRYQRDINFGDRDGDLATKSDYRCVELR